MALQDKSKIFEGPILWHRVIGLLVGLIFVITILVYLFGLDLGIEDSLISAAIEFCSFIPVMVAALLFFNNRTGDFKRIFWFSIIAFFLFSVITVGVAYFQIYNYTLTEALSFILLKTSVIGITLSLVSTKLQEIMEQTFIASPSVLNDEKLEQGEVKEAINHYFQEIERKIALYGIGNTNCIVTYLESFYKQFVLKRQPELVIKLLENAQDIAPLRERSWDRFFRGYFHTCPVTKSHVKRMKRSSNRVLKKLRKISEEASIQNGERVKVLLHHVQTLSKLHSMGLILTEPSEASKLVKKLESSHSNRIEN